MTQLTRPKYFFPNKSAADLVVGPIQEPMGQSMVHVGTPSKIGDCGQASAALTGLVVNKDVYALEVSATGSQSALGGGTLIEFIPNPIPDRYQTGMPKEGWAWHRFKAADGSDAFIGWPEGEPVGPENFERASMGEGAAVIDDNDDRWIVPIARARDNEHGRLPTRWVMTADGLQTKIAKEYESLWEFGGEVMGYLRAMNAFSLDQVQPPESWKDPWAFHATLRVLGTYYHLGEAEMILLDANDAGIMSVTFVSAVLHGFTDYRCYIEYLLQKKTKEAASISIATSNSSSGSEAA